MAFHIRYSHFQRKCMNMWTTPTATTHRPPSLKATLNMVSFYWLYFFSACIFRCICFCERCCCSTFQVAKYCTKTHFTVFRHSLKCGQFNSKHARAGSFTYIGLGHEFKVGQNDNQKLLVAKNTSQSQILSNQHMNIHALYMFLYNCSLPGKGSL